MKFIDTHTHIYDQQFSDDIDDTIKRSLDNGVTKMYMPNCDSTTIDSMIQMTERYPDVCYPMMGLHPCYVKDNFENELKVARQHLENGRFYAIGEIGLDYYWDLTFKEQQIQAFETQIDWALEFDLPIVIHSRESLQDCIDIVKKKQNGKLKGIFHCFSGTENEAKQIVELDFILGIGGVVTFKNSKLAEAIKGIDLSAIVLETDAPYLAPTPHRGKRNESSYIPLIAQKLGDIYKTSINNIASITTENAEKLFSK